MPNMIAEAVSVIKIDNSYCRIVEMIYLYGTYLYMKNITPLFIILLLLSIGCSKPQKQSCNPEAKQIADSIVFANRNIDSLRIILQRFADSDNKIGEIVACKELGKCYREDSRFVEAVDCHKRGARIAAQIGDTLELIQAFNNIGTNFRRM